MMTIDPRTPRTPCRTPLRSAGQFLCAGLLAAAMALPCLAQSAAPAAEQSTPAAATPSPEIAMSARLQALYPSTRFGAVNPTPWPGVFEVVMGANIAYVDASGQYFLFGHLYDMKAQRDLTAEHKDTLARIDFNALPLSDAMKEVRGNGSRVLAIFSDPDCPYCRKLESDIRSLTDVTIYTFLMPLASLHTAAHAKAVSVWCAKDRIAAPFDEGKYREIKAANPGSLLLCRMGDFYEFFFEDAEVAAKALGVDLAKRVGQQGSDIPMCGAPFENAQDYLWRLISLGHRVVVRERVEDSVSV